MMKLEIKKIENENIIRIISNDSIIIGGDQLTIIQNNMCIDITICDNKAIIDICPDVDNNDADDNSYEHSIEIKDINNIFEYTVDGGMSELINGLYNHKLAY